MDPTPCDGIADGVRGPVIGDATAVARVGPDRLDTWTAVGDAEHVHTPPLATIASRVHAPFFAPSLATIASPIGRRGATFDPAASSDTHRNRRRHGSLHDG